MFAGMLAILLGVVHSVLGEILIFSRLPDLGDYARINAIRLKPRHLRTLWSSWHLVTLLGWGFGAMLLWMAAQGGVDEQAVSITSIIALTFIASSLFWLFGTRGKHPAWVVLIIIAALTWWAGGG